MSIRTVRRIGLRQTYGILRPTIGGKPRDSRHIWAILKVVLGTHSPMRILETSSEKGRSKPTATSLIGDPFSSKSYTMLEGTILVL